MIVLAVIGRSAVLPLAQTSADGPLSSSTGYNVFCGPRCVHRVLELYGIKTELTDIIAEMQGPSLSGQASFGDLVRCFEQRGIQTKMVALGPLDIPDWQYPAILHMDGNHFIVLEKTGTTTATVKDGACPSADLSLWDIKWRASKFLLLTAKSPIGNDCFVQLRFRYAAVALGTLMIAPLALRCVQKARGRWNGRGAVAKTRIS